MSEQKTYYIPLVKTGDEITSFESEWAMGDSYPTTGRELLDYLAEHSQHHQDGEFICVTSNDGKIHDYAKVWKQCCDAWGTIDRKYDGQCNVASYDDLMTYLED